MRILRLVSSAAVSLLFAAAFAVPAFGATAPALTSAAASTPVDASAGGPIEIQIWPGQQGRTAVITAVALDAKVKLPATVRIPVTPGTTVEWAGEITGGTAEGDIEQPFTLVQGRGGQFAEFTLTKSHRGQIDALGAPLELTGDMVTVSVEYVQSVDSTLTTFAVRVPANVSKVQVAPQAAGEPVTNVEGEALYALSPKAMKPGEKQTIGVTYSTVPPAEPAPGSSLNPVLLILVAALAVAVVAMVVLVRRNAAPQAAEEFDAEDEEYDEARTRGEKEAVPENDEADDAWT